MRKTREIERVMRHSERGLRETTPESKHSRRRNGKVKAYKAKRRVAR